MVLLLLFQQLASRRAERGHSALGEQPDSVVAAICVELALLRCSSTSDRQWGELNGLAPIMALLLLLANACGLSHTLSPGSAKNHSTPSSVSRESVVLSSLMRSPETCSRNQQALRYSDSHSVWKNCRLRASRETVKKRSWCPTVSFHLLQPSQWLQLRVGQRT